MNKMSGKWIMRPDRSWVKLAPNPMTNYDLSVAIYNSQGVSGIYKAIEDGRLSYDCFRYCAPCESNHPHEDDTCLVCGTQNSPHWGVGFDGFITKLMEIK
jgi:hypothetical protein